MRRLPGAALLVALVVALVAPAAAYAGELVDRAAQALGSDPVYVHPDAEPALTEAEADALRAEIRESGAAPTFIAVLPSSASAQEGGGPEEVLAALARAADRPGTFAVVVGGRFRAGSTDLPSGVAGSLATEAFERRRDEGIAATLEEWIELVGRARAGASENASEDGGDGISPAWLLCLGAAGVGGYAVLRRRRRQRRLEALRALVRDDLTALAEDVSSLELDVDMPGADPRAREAYTDALRRYEEAGDALDRARRPEDVEPVAAAVSEGRHSMAVARARLAGQEPPERRPPCFFDPRHGPSVRDVMWAPPGGEERPVPACEADADRVENGVQPEARTVDVRGRQVPYWEAGPQVAPWASGFFGGAAAAFPLLFVGSALGAALAPPSAGADTAGDDSGFDGGGDDFDGGGDFGGGGGDFGGGGGDFGGGGGDF